MERRIFQFFPALPAFLFLMCAGYVGWVGFEGLFLCQLVLLMYDGCVQEWYVVILYIHSQQEFYLMIQIIESGLATAELQISASRFPAFSVNALNEVFVTVKAYTTITTASSANESENFHQTQRKNEKPREGKGRKRKIMQKQGT